MNQSSVNALRGAIYKVKKNIKTICFLWIKLA